MKEQNWTIKVSKKLSKSIADLPVTVKERTAALFKNLENQGPMQPNWPNFTKLGATTYHCHIKKGKPTYVACWCVLDKEEKLIEVYYVGTHEKAPY